MNDLVTIKTAITAIDLALPMNYLEENGIDCYLKDELMAQVYVSAATGGVKLQVPEEKAEEAIKLLIEGGFAKLEDYEADETMIEIGKIIEKIRSFFNG